MQTSLRSLRSRLFGDASGAWHCTVYTLQCHHTQGGVDVVGDVEAALCTMPHCC